jgi:translation initiation factor 1
MGMKKREGGLVFSTEQGRMCPECRNPVADCTCGQPERPSGDGVVRVSRECGTGGTVKDGVVEIQGDQRDILVPLLQQKGWTVKKSGG